MPNHMNVLLVDDSEDDYIITRDLFFEMRDSNINLEWISSYEMALDRIKDRSHDVYVFDYSLGEHTGLELLAWAVEHGVHAPMILLTGRHDRDIELLALQAGASDFLEKGTTDAALLDRTIRYSTDHAHKLETLRHLAVRDELTGLVNRREMDRVLQNELSRCQRYGHPLGLILIDIDNFKVVNDTFGHQAGDKILRSLAQLLSGKLRAPDSIARYGGEEFALILPETSEESIYLVAERLRMAVEEFDFTPPLRRGQSVKLSLTISLGAAHTGDAAYTPERILATADRALYEAKRLGRNCTVSLANSLLTTAPLPTIPLMAT